MLLDRDGNTILHYLCMGGVKESEFELIKWLVETQKIRFIRNNDHDSPFDLIRGYPKKKLHFKNAKNYRKEVSDYFEQVLNEDPTLEDVSENLAIHLAVIRG